MKFSLYPIAIVLALSAFNDPSGDPATTDDKVDAFYPADLDTTRGLDDTLNVPDSSARSVTH